MVDTVFLYISAAADLEVERDSLSRAVTEVPVSLGWRIVQTPIRGEPVNLEAVARADFHILLLGCDIRAPIGMEWLTARRTGHMPALFLKGDTARTPAGESFHRHLAEITTWRTYPDIPGLCRQVLYALAVHFIERVGYYQFSMDEVTRLQEWKNGLDAPRAKKEPLARSVAGDSSVILTSERYIPSEGVLLKPRKNEAEND